MAGYVNRRTGFCPWQTPNPGGELFWLWFLTNDLLWFHCTFLHFYSRLQVNLCVLDVPDKKYQSYLCPNMIDFDAANFSEYRSEEVISFFWRSVYFKIAIE